jgi:hypothetical protein
VPPEFPSPRRGGVRGGVKTRKEPFIPSVLLTKL